MNEPKISRRESAKAERRARIIQAAHDLLREKGMDGLMVKAVALRADVSLSTIYNLFSSQTAVLAGVFDQDLAHFELLVTKASSADTLVRMFDAVDIAADMYKADPAFYRAVMVQDERSSPPEDSGWSDRRIQFWPGLVQQAIDRGLLRKGAYAAVLGELMNQAMGGAVWNWAGGRISIERMRLDTKLAYALLLSRFATRQTTARLRVLADELCERLCDES